MSDPSEKAILYGESLGVHLPTVLAWIEACPNKLTQAAVRLILDRLEKTTQLRAEIELKQSVLKETEDELAAFLRVLRDCHRQAEGDDFTTLDAKILDAFCLGKSA